MKKTILVLGAGKIGRMVTHLLARCGDYSVRVGDRDRAAAERVGQHLPDVRAQEVDFTQASDLDRFLRGGDAVISCAPFSCNPLIAERARAQNLHYLDLTEDVEVSRRAVEVARGARTAFIPQCGLAPGFITIVAVHLMAEMTDVTDLRRRVGALRARAFSRDCASGQATQASQALRMGRAAAPGVPDRCAALSMRRKEEAARRGHRSRSDRRDPRARGPLRAGAEARSRARTAGA
jgi:hypothetical protein